MPSATDFRKSFRLGKGEAVGKFEIEASQVGHEVVQENEKYDFPTSITLRLGGGTPQQALSAFKKHVKGPRIVYSAYGSPYNCSIGGAKLAGGSRKGRTQEEHVEGEGEQATITCMGKAVRRRDTPTLKEVKEKEREEKGESDELDAEEEELLSGMRVIKSRFGTSKCSKCGGTIDPGLRIARPEGAQGRGGWAHVRCVVEAAKAKQGPSTPKKGQRKAPPAKGAGKAPAKGTAGAAAGKRRVQKVTQQAVQAGRRKRARR